MESSLQPCGYMGSYSPSTNRYLSSYKKWSQTLRFQAPSGSENMVTSLHPKPGFPSLAGVSGRLCRVMLQEFYPEICKRRGSSPREICPRMWGIGICLYISQQQAASLKGRMLEMSLSQICIPVPGESHWIAKNLSPSDTLPCVLFSVWCSRAIWMYSTKQWWVVNSNFAFWFHLSLHPLFLLYILGYKLVKLAVG